MKSSSGDTSPRNDDMVCHYYRQIYCVLVGGACNTEATLWNIWHDVFYDPFFKVRIFYVVLTVTGLLLLVASSWHFALNLHGFSLPSALWILAQWSLPSVGTATADAGFSVWICVSQRGCYRHLSNVPQKFKHPYFSIFIAIWFFLIYSTLHIIRLTAMMYSNHLRAVKLSSWKNWKNGWCDRGATEYGLRVQGATNKRMLKTTDVNDRPLPNPAACTTCRCATSSLCTSSRSNQIALKQNSSNYIADSTLLSLHSTDCCPLLVR